LHTETLVFIPAWNEAENLPAVLRELHQELPDVDVLVVDDGSTDRTADAARAGGAEVTSFDENRGLKAAIAAGYAHARDHGYTYCGRIDADGQHPAHELRRLLELVHANACDVAVGSRFVSDDTHAAHRYTPTPERALGTAALRRLMALRLERPIGDATSGLYAVNATAIPLLAEPYSSGAPEVEGLIRIVEGGLRLEEVPVDMRERASGESKLHGMVSVKLVVTVVLAIFTGWKLWRRRV
jgi:glycosyltransferase involved in cell wall biosynthesis